MDRRRSDFPWLRVWLTMCQPCFSPRTESGERFFGFPFSLNSDDGGSKPNNWEALRFVSFALHSLPTGGRCAQDISARHLQNCLSEDVHPYGSTALFGDFRAQKPRSEGIHSLQVSQNELAEPYKYSNTLRTSSTTVCCIPFMTVGAVANQRRGERESLAFVRDFHWRIQTPANGSAC
jgi:hypothetical protein